MMRIATMIFAGSVAALTVLATPALARNNSDAAKPAEDNASSASPCHAYQMAADGSWTQLPCQEEGAARQPPPRKSVTRNGTEAETH
ncbi:hypothetical protein [Bradyrhizobium sp. ARR65]|uniref:hypothetical protein n=1 Tax=Bradyrhizobium sp. ARR65 TaxID=1040989 RepID=UPI000AE22691